MGLVGRWAGRWFILWKLWLERFISHQKGSVAFKGLRGAAEGPGPWKSSEEDRTPAPSCVSRHCFLPQAPGCTFLPAALRDRHVPGLQPGTQAFLSACQWPFVMLLSLPLGIPSGHGALTFPSPCLACPPPLSPVLCLSRAFSWHLQPGLLHGPGRQVLDRLYSSFPSIGYRYLGSSDCFLI